MKLTDIMHIDIEGPATPEAIGAAFARAGAELAQSDFGRSVSEITDLSLGLRASTPVVGTKAGIRRCTLVLAVEGDFKK